MTLPPLDPVARRLLRGDVQHALQVTENAQLIRNETVAASSDGLAEFTPFPRLAPEIRGMVWKLAMEGEEPRLVHLRARNLGIKPFQRRGCPEDEDLDGRTITIDGAIYCQAPAYFFVNRESRYWALRHYNIRFQVAQIPIEQDENVFASLDNALMCPDDILVPWYLEEHLRERGGFVINFSDEAALVRNILVHPWKAINPKNPREFDYEGYRMAVKLIKTIGNINSIEKVFVRCQKSLVPYRYAGFCKRRYRGEIPRAVADFLESGTALESVIAKQLARLVQWYFLETKPARSLDN
ncbi:hypothetical protein F4861DRAFT_545830 [Xylaria intraflava]|nr:hypothetical protein F4861DRAFT_545830 [Xylaria intraflava]